MDLTLVPLEILVKILLHLAVPDACALRTTNHFFCALYRLLSTQLQLRIRMQDGSRLV